ncbi:MAG: class I SAM-dependent methyltransferase [Candidatus Thorarchaeota archaeon]|nr:MAG: class I SAM-dependent methyltransferase [Candidatus Thorarchaeota archaeon]
MSSFDKVALAYDDAIDWEARLAREMPFLISRLGNPKGKRVLDLACGTGRHSVTLALEEAEVTGIDNSEVMITRAKQHAATNDVSPKFILGEMTEVHSITADQYDLIICLGNSLALLDNLNNLEIVLSSVYNSLNEGGVFVAQALNFKEIHRTGFRFFPQKVGKMDTGEDVVFSRFFEHTDPPNSSTLVMSAQMKVKGEWTSLVSTLKVLNFNSDLLKRYLVQAGFQETSFYSDYSESPFVGSDDRNVVISSLR